MKSNAAKKTTSKELFIDPHLSLQYELNLPRTSKRTITKDLSHYLKRDSPKLSTEDKLCVILQLPYGCSLKSYRILPDGNSMKVYIDIHKLTWHSEAIHDQLIHSGSIDDNHDSRRGHHREDALEQAIQFHDQRMNNYISRREMVTTYRFKKTVDKNQNVIVTSHNFGVGDNNQLMVAFAYFEMFLKDETKETKTPEQVEVKDMTFWGQGGKSDSSCDGNSGDGGGGSTHGARSKKGGGSSVSFSSRSRSHRHEIDDEDMDEDEDEDMDDDGREGQAMAEIERLRSELLFAQNRNCDLDYKLATKEKDHEWEKNSWEEENKEMACRLDESTKSLHQAIARYDDKNRRAMTIEEKLKDKIGQSEQQKQKVELLQKQSEFAQNKVEAQQSELERLRQQLHKKEAALGTANAELHKKEAALGIANAELHKKEAALGNANSTLQDLVNENLGLKGENMLVLHNDSISTNKRPRKVFESSFVGNDVSKESVMSE